MSDFHYFASHALGWATAETKEDAIEKLWRQFTSGDIRKWLQNAHKSGEFGLHFWCCRVPLPADADYRIEYYAPKVEGVTEGGNYILTYYTSKVMKWRADPEDQVRRLEQRFRDLEIVEVDDPVEN